VFTQVASSSAVLVENHTPNVGGQVHGGEGYKRVGNYYKNSYYIYQSKTITKCGVDTPSEPNSEIPTYPLEHRRVDRNNTNKIKREKRDTPSN